MPSPAIKALITRFDRACQDLAFKGSMHPDDWDEIEHAYAAARKALEQHIDNLVRRIDNLEARRDEAFKRG